MPFRWIARWPAERWGVPLLLAACAALDLYRLGAPTLFDQDEGQYAEIAREIVQTGDPITLHVNGQPWYTHPPLYMWLVAATGRLLGFSEWTVRIWSAVFSLVALYATVLLGRALFGRRVGLLGGVILGVTLQYLMQARLAVFDTALLAWTLLAVYAFCRAFETGRRADYLWFFMFTGLATLTKGPIGLGLPALVLVVFVGLRQAWSRWREVPWGAGLSLYALVGLSWYALQVWLHGWTFLSSNVGYYTLHRYFGVVEKHAGPWYFYLPVALFGGFPWSAFWPPAAAIHLRRWRVSDGSLLVLLWVAIPILFFSGAQTKLPGYVISIYPFAALGVAALWEPVLSANRLSASVRIALWALLVLLAALIGTAAVFLAEEHPGPYQAARGVLTMPAAMLAAGIGITLALTAAGRARSAFVALCTAMAVTWLALLVLIMPLVEAQKPIKPLAEAINGALRPGDRIVGYKMYIYPSLIFYTRHPVEWAETVPELRADLCAPGRVFLVITKESLGRLPVIPAGLRPAAERAGTLLLVKPATMQCASARADGHR